MGGEDEVGRSGRWRALPWRRRPAALLTACALGACTAPAAAQPGELPGWWLAESPGTSGARFGLGLDYLFEDLDSLLNAASTQTVTLVDLRGGRSTQVIRGDPGLNNRKFDYEVEVESWGIQAPIALPRLRLGRRVTLFPSLVTEVATTEITFDFRDRTVAGDSTSISGRAVSWGLGLEGVAALGRGGSWFLGAGYRFRSLPDVDLERSPALVDVGSGRQPGQLVSFVRDEVALSQDTHLASLRLGRAFAGGRVNPWVGIRGRWTDVEIDDEIGFVSPLDDLDGDGVPDLQTDLVTRSRFESDSVLAVAGVDAQLGDSMVGRAEVAVGDGDVGAFFKVVYLFGPDDEEKDRENAREITAVLVEAFERIEGMFVARWELLREEATGQGTYSEADVEKLLQDTKDELLAVLDAYPVTAPLAAYVQDRFEQWEKDLPSIAEHDLTRDRPRMVVAQRIAAGSNRRVSGVVPALQAGIDRRRTDGLLGEVFAFLGQLVGAGRTNRLTIGRVCIKTAPRDRAQFRMWAKARSQVAARKVQTNSWIREVWRGKYYYRFDLEGMRRGCPDPKTGSEEECSPLDLWSDPRSLIECDLDTGHCGLGEQPTVRCEQ